MKIAILVWLFTPRWLAATEPPTHNIARHLAKRGHEVQVITSLDEGLLRESIEQGFCVDRIGFPRIRFVGFMLFWLKALLQFKKLKSEIVHQQSLMLSVGVVGFLARKLLKKPYVACGRGADVYLPWLLKKLISKLLLKYADTAIALTEDMRREMQKIWNRDILVILNRIDSEKFNKLRRDEMRREMPAKYDERLILFVGTFHPKKGVSYLVEAMALMRQDNLSARLLLIGDGQERQSLETLVGALNLGDVVTFVGEVPHGKVRNYMVASDVLVLPSRSEGFPNVVLEAFEEILNRRA